MHFQHPIISNQCILVLWLWKIATNVQRKEKKNKIKRKKQWHFWHHDIITVHFLHVKHCIVNNFWTVKSEKWNIMFSQLILTRTHTDIQKERCYCNMIHLFCFVFFLWPCVQICDFSFFALYIFLYVFSNDDFVSLHLLFSCLLKKKKMNKKRNTENKK